jgi:hypothetical protein
MINARNSLSESLIITGAGSGKTVLILILMSRDGRSQEPGVRSQEPGVRIQNSGVRMIATSRPMNRWNLPNSWNSWNSRLPLLAPGSWLLNLTSWIPDANKRIRSGPGKRRCVLSGTSRWFSWSGWREIKPVKWVFGTHRH